jgi:hypothetical protein
MKSRWITLALCLLVLVVLIVRVLPHAGRHSQEHSSSGRQAASASAYSGLRSLVLEGSRANFGLGPGSSPTQPFAVVADWGSPKGSTTIVAIADGSASVYLSSGAGFIGAGQSHDSIRNAALKTVELAAAVQSLMRRTTQFPLASPQQVTFYAVTDTGVFTASASEDDLAGNRSPFSPLAAAAQNILTEYRNLPRTR